NCPGGRESYRALRHSAWAGLTPTDVIFPSFIFIMGVSLVFSLSRRLEAGKSERRLLRKTLRRTAILFVLGLVYNGFPLVGLSRLRFMNVLQRIAICYFFSALLFLKTSFKTQVLAGIALLAGY